MKDYLVKAIDREKRVRIYAASTTNLVEYARKIHGTSPTATAALGRALTAGAIMGAMMKNDKDLLTLKISGGGPLGDIVIVSRNNGTVKGLVGNPLADAPSTAEGKLDVGAVVGNDGLVTVIIDLGLKEPYVGQADIISGEIAEDIANYYMVSEQVPTAVALGVLIDRDITVKASGGYILQLLPDIKDEEITQIENSLKNIKPVSTLINEGLTPEEIIANILPEFDMEIIDKMDLEYKCDCSREKIEAMLVSLGKKELEDIINEDGKAEVVCHFCNTKYNFDKSELEKILLTINK
ncbi:Hsp33 family molecular chaperone HslO [Soehngenia saccharolytica]|nr:Hsp33 family molecular chaperone HslO [Soehngenia saccharolytica]